MAYSVSAPLTLKGDLFIVAVCKNLTIAHNIAAMLQGARLHKLDGLKISDSVTHVWAKTQHNDKLGVVYVAPFSIEKPQDADVCQIAINTLLHLAHIKAYYTSMDISYGKQLAALLDAV
jgi:hypothetical protein